MQAPYSGKQAPKNQKRENAKKKESAHLDGGAEHKHMLDGGHKHPFCRLNKPHCTDRLFLPRILRWHVIPAPQNMIRNVMRKAIWEAIRSLIRNAN